MKLKEFFAKTQGSRQLRLAGQKEDAMCGRDFWKRYRNTEAWEMEVSKVNLIPARATIGALWFDTVICEIELAAAQDTAQEPPKDGQHMKFRDGRVKLEPGAEFDLNRREDVEAMIKKIVREMFKAWADTAKDGGCIVIQEEEAAQTAKEAAQDAPEAAVGKDTAQGVEADMRDTWEAIADILTGRKAAPEGCVINLNVNVEDTAQEVTTFPAGGAPDKQQEEN